MDLLVAHLRNIDPQSISALALVCSALLAKARYAQLQEVSLDFGRGAGRASQRVCFLAQDAPLPAIRALHVRPPFSLERSLGQLNAGSSSARRQKALKARRKALEAELAPWKQLGDLVPQMPGLRDLHWGSAVIPDRVLEFLAHNPQVRLHLSVDMQLFPGCMDEAVAAINALPARLACIRGLSSLRIKIVYGKEIAALRALLQDSLKSLMSSPRLRSLGLDIGFPTSGCVWHSPSRDYCGFGFAAGENFPSLEELDVVDYPWGWPPWLPRGLFWVDGYPTAWGPGTEMDHWASLRDWSRLRRLRLVGHSVMLTEPLAPKLTALKHIELITQNPVLNTRIAPAFATLPCTLTSITLAILPPDLTTVIISHAASLRALTVYDVPIPPTDLALLRDNLPNLDTLTLCCDLKPNPDHNLDPNPAVRAACPYPWPCTTATTTNATTLLTTLAGFPRLASLTLHISPHPTPPITITTPGLLLAALRARGAARLRTLRLNVSGARPGSREDAQLELELGVRPALHQNSSSSSSSKVGLVCTRPSDSDQQNTAAGMDSESGDGDAMPLLATSRCENLSWAQNERLRR
ncbi:hypothetical protein NEMBOFW57_009325 [Staphylotrichum longicolle]|uniref:Uncharacterized protein n=1 Tax=Staphylotrichum longicolle TaxID=669026 RepID=A0AAD4HVC8_9PEZI|nr:hypothetical protein NEMBOFW57_009325 [Staphylotrichum longicolle]